MTDEQLFAALTELGRKLDLLISKQEKMEKKIQEFESLEEQSHNIVIEGTDFFLKSLN